MVFDSDRSGNFEIYSMVVSPNPQLGTLRALTSDPNSDSWWARVSPDRRPIVFVRTPRGTHDLDYSKVSLWVMNFDGSNQRLLRAAGRDGWQMQGHPEWSPDGSQLVVFGGSAWSAQIFIIDAETGAIDRPLTDRPGINLDPSWSAVDPGSVLFLGCPSSPCFELDYEVYRVAVTGGATTRLTTNNHRDHDPYLSRLGTRIFWSQQTNLAANAGAGVWSLLSMRPDGSNQTSVTRDGAITSLCQWTMGDDQAIYFHRVVAPTNHFGIYRSAASGGAMTEILVDGFTNEFPSF